MDDIRPIVIDNSWVYISIMVELENADLLANNFGGLLTNWQMASTREVLSL